MTHFLAAADGWRPSDNIACNAYLPNIRWSSSKLGTSNQMVQGPYFNPSPYIEIGGLKDHFIFVSGKLFFSFFLLLPYDIYLQ